MNKLILIGNGFDLSHGLKTRYIDFILWYLNKAFKELSEQNKYNDSLIGIYSNYGVPMTEFKSISDFKDFLKEYTNIKISYKYPFFQRLLDFANEPNWVDIESRYYYYLLQLYKRIEEKEKEYRNENRTFAVDRDLVSLNKCFEIIKDKLKEYLKIIDSNLPKQNTEIKDHFLSILNEEHIGEPNDVHLLNFNYTSTVEIYKEHFDNVNLEINHIHGKLNDESNPIIFGYGDEMDAYYEKMERLNRNDFLKNFKSFGYFNTNNYQNFTWFMNTRPFDVYILGHSCGLSDRILLNSIVENDKCNRIRLYYYEKNEVEDDYFEKTQELSRHFKSDSKGLMRNIIVPKPESVPLIKFK